MATPAVRKITATFSTSSSRPPSTSGNALENWRPGATSPRLYDLNMDLEKYYLAMERGHRVTKINISRRGERECSQRHCCIKRETRQIILSKTDAGSKSNLSKPSCIDMRTVKEIKTLEHKVGSMKIADKWKPLGANYDSNKVLIIYHGTQFVLNVLILACNLLITFFVNNLHIIFILTNCFCSRHARLLSTLVGRFDNFS